MGFGDPQDEKEVDLDLEGNKKARD